MFVLVCLVPVHVSGGGPQSGSRWSARSTVRTNDLEAGEDLPHTYRPWERGKDVVVQVICCLPGGNVFGRPLRVPAPGLIWWPWLWHLLCHNHSRTLCKRAVQKIG